MNQLFLVLLLLLFSLPSLTFAQTQEGARRNIAAEKEILALISTYDAQAESTGHPDFNLLKKALKESQKIKYIEGIQQATDRYTVEYIRKNKYQEAMNMVDIALNVTDSVLCPRHYGALFTQKGNISQFQKKHAEAIQFYQHAMIYYTRIGDKVEIANTLISIGNVYFKTGDTEKSEQNLLLASKTFDQIKGSKNKKMVPVLRHLAAAYDKQGNFKEALGILNQSLALYKTNEDYQGTASTLVSIGNIQSQLKNFNLATKAFTEAIELSKKHNLKISLLESYQGLSNIKSIQKEYKSAFDFYNKYIEVKDTMYEESKYEKLEDLKSILELRIKNQQIDILNTKNELSEVQTERQRTITYGLIGASIFFLIITSLVVQRNRLRKKVNHLLIEQNKELTELNERTKKSEQELMNLNLTKDKFFSIIAHDLRSPIASLIGFLNLLEENSATFTHEELMHFCKQMKNSVHNLNDLMNNLLQWALTQSGAIECKPKQFSLNELIEKNKALFIPTLREKNLTLQYDASGNDTITADINMIDFVIRNLIQNAVKFTKSGGLIIIRQESKNGFVNLSIEDNGIGIPEHNIPNLFRIDYKNKQQGTSHEKGTGLGLILSREFMERNGGDISARSVHGEGTTFTLSFISEDPT